MCDQLCGEGLAARLGEKALQVAMVTFEAYRLASENNTLTTNVPYIILKIALEGE